MKSNRAIAVLEVPAKPRPMKLSVCGIAALVVGCESAPGAEMLTARDSAGVHVTTSSRPVWEGTTGWRVDPNPSLAIGAVDGPPEYTFDGIVSVHAYGEATIVVERDKIRVFDGDGEFTRSIGRAGSGPGEFGYIVTSAVCDDRVYASDMRRSTAPIYRVNGELVGEFWDKHQNNGAEPMLAGCARGGLIVYPSRPPDPSRPRDRTVREPIPLLYVDRQLRVVDTVTAAPGMEVYDGLRRPFGRMSLWAVADSMLYVIDTGISEVRVLSLTGTLKRIHRLPIEPAAVTAEDMERVRDQYLTGLPPTLEREIAPRLEAVGFPDKQPLFDDIEVDPEGNIWLEAYQEDRAVARSWHALSPEGQWLGIVAFPPGFVVHAFTNDQVLGVWTNDLGVEFARWYRILKTAR